MTHAVALLHKGNIMWYPGVRQPRSELQEELVWCRHVGDENCQAPDGRRALWTTSSVRHPCSENDEKEMLSISCDGHLGFSINPICQKKVGNI